MPVVQKALSTLKSPGASQASLALRTEIVFGPGAAARLGELARQCGGRRVLIVTDPGIVQAGHVDRAEESLRAAGLAVARFDQVVENPTTRVVDECVAAARSHRADLLVGLGGGSSMDTAKGCNFLLTNGGRMEDYWGRGKAARPMLTLVAVPTTAGTGSECQSYALISQEKSHAKMACGDPKAAARIALLDPELTLTQPRAVAAATGLDALSHAVESAVTTARNAFSQMFAREAFRRCSRSFERVLSCPDDLDARGNMLLGAALAGLAIENSVLGAAHSAANPLTSHYGVAHGQAVALMLPAVVRLNAENDEAFRMYSELAMDAGLAPSGTAQAEAAEALAGFLEQARDLAGMAGSLSELGIHAPPLALLAEEAAGQWTARFNPRPVAAEDFIDLYRRVSA
ncbi:MAG: iron-containing alcohol dehydrogenase [Pirellulales bacterium]|nr:iron-containing alcohol dehydrogenase [Pirellulales bacterium]